MIVYGSGSSLLTNLAPGGGPSEDVWDAFDEAIDRSGASHVFGLGDHARPGNSWQWQACQKHLQRSTAAVHLIRGDLDRGPLPGYEAAGGGAANRMVDVGRNRFVLLDNRTMFSAEDLQFLGSACSEHESRANTFVMTHSRLFELDDDKSNWNRDVVPILKEHGVRYVFCGETNDAMLSTHVVPRRAEAPDLFYFCPGFHFSGYRGPGLYVELRFDGDELTGILPRAIPLDVRHPWFKFHPGWDNGATRAAPGDWLPEPEVSGPAAGKVVWSLPDEKQEGITRMALWGHAYSMHIDNHDDGRIETEELISAFVDELNRLEFDHVFALGDHVFEPSSADEWAIVKKHFTRIHAQLHMIRGNHERIEKLPVLEELAGDVRNNQVVIGRNRFVLFGYREVYSPDDLAYLDRAFTPSADVANTFFLTHLMSYRYRPVSECPPGVDPNKPYGGYSNWNTDVLPLLDGRVKYVFFGDIYKRLAGHCVAPNGTYYITTGFMFRGERPLAYLDLHFRGDELIRAIPRTVPIDLRNGWYYYEKP
ncbi:MAG: hypothetical protein KDC98_10555 [Planctomycetes bacterium]|nr:hypothetical protein [Planctomycetota bacterium]